MSSIRAALMRRTLPFAAALLLWACEQPPTKELAAAQRQVDLAREAGAAEYAPARLLEAEAAMQDAQRKVGVKDYRGALSAASDAADKAKHAAKAAGAARTLARGAAETARAEARFALEEVAKVKAEALEDKVPEAAFEELEPRAQKLQQDLEAVAAILNRGEIIEAQKAARSIKAEAVALPAMYRGAVDAWQAAHPKVRARVPAKASAKPAAKPAAKPTAKPPARKR
jgi:hypothetical protein